MPPGLATLVFAVFIGGLFVLDRRPPARACPGLWVPVIWLSIAASRMVSTWLQITPADDTADVYLEGSPIDRVILTGLLLAGALVLVARRQRVLAFLRENGPLLLFFGYCVVSVLWSDYPDVAIKRWMKAIGDLVMVAIVATDRDPAAAIRRLLTRVGFLVIPISLLLIKYYPDLGRGYNRWTWTMYYSGVSYGKNGLGYVCMIFGMVSLWRLLASLWPADGKRAWGSVIAHSLNVGIALWLFAKIDSATSLACFVVGGAVLTVTSLPRFQRYPVSAHAVVGGVVAVALAGLLVTAGMNVAEAMGRDTTLTGRTDLWETLLQVRADPLFGSGFESFWLGDRVDALWAKYWWHPIQAHNGYLEMFLNLGIVGLGMLGIVLAWGYRNAAAALWRTPEVGRLRLAFVVVALVYNLTEAAFKTMHPVWFVLLLMVANPPRARDESSENSRPGGVDGTVFSSDARMIA